MRPILFYKNIQIHNFACVSNCAKYLSILITPWRSKWPFQFIHHANYPKMHFLSNFLIKKKTNCQFMTFSAQYQFAKMSKKCKLQICILFTEIVKFIAWICDKLSCEKFCWTNKALMIPRSVENLFKALLVKSREWKIILCPPTSDKERVFYNPKLNIKLFMRENLFQKINMCCELLQKLKRQCAVG